MTGRAPLRRLLPGGRIFLPADLCAASGRFLVAECEGDRPCVVSRGRPSTAINVILKTTRPERIRFADGAFAFRTRAA